MRLFAAIDGDLISLLVFAAIYAISAFVNWMRRRQLAKEDSGSLVSRSPDPASRHTRTRPAPVTTQPPATEAPKRPRMTDWEAELRRLLEGDSPADAAPTSAPPVIARAEPESSAPPKQPPSQPRRRSQPGRQQSPERARPGRAPGTSSGPIPSPTPAQLELPADLAALAREAEAAAPRLASLAGAASAIARAQSIQGSVARMMRAVDLSTTAHRPAPVATLRRGGSIEATRARALLASPSGARQAMIAAVLLAPPRCAEPWGASAP